MAKIDDGEGLTRAKIYRMKGRVVYKKARGGGVVAQAWPRKRGPKKSELQQRYVDRFKQGIEMWKLAGSGVACVADNLGNAPFAPNYFPRDVFMSALNGKHFDYVGNDEINDYRCTQGEYGCEGVWRVTTPTARVRRTSYESVSSGVLTPLTPNDVLWDNNDFWNASPNPTRLTFHVKGLYMIGGSVFWNNPTASSRNLILRVNGTDEIEWQYDYVPTTQYQHQSIASLYVFDAGDYLEICGRVYSTGGTVKLNGLWVVGIVPEMIV